MSLPCHRFQLSKAKTFDFVIFPNDDLFYAGWWFVEVKETNEQGWAPGSLLLPADGNYLADINVSRKTNSVLIFLSSL